MDVNTSSDTDKSVFLWYFLEYGRDNEDEDFVLKNDVSTAPWKPATLDELEGSANNHFFFVGMTYMNKLELMNTLIGYTLTWRFWKTKLEESSSGVLLPAGEEDVDDDEELLVPTPLPDNPKE